MDDASGLLLSGAHLQHHYYGGDDNENKDIGWEYHAGSHVQDRAQFEADKQAVYRLELIGFDDFSFLVC